ncbi:MAG: hypothetical protein ACOYZ6_15640 [Chloroflexota bacterium]
MRLPGLIRKAGRWILLTGGMSLGVALAFTIRSPVSQAIELPTRTPSHPASAPTSTASPRPLPKVAVTPQETEAAQKSLPNRIGLDPALWMEWPEVPIVPQHIRDVYALGQSLGNDPSAFSIFGDCQSLPEVFLGLYATDEALFDSLPAPLQETALHFEDSLNRLSPTGKDGTTAGALLWEAWHENEFGCSPNETPMECELRAHRPSFVLIMVGTHWEGARNEFYMRRILDTLLERGVVPILSTKADNREGDHGINLQTAKLAAEYNIPLWNFWPVTGHLPNRGLYTRDTERHLGDVYLTEEALDLHRYSALMALDAVWRAATGN